MIYTYVEKQGARLFVRTVAKDGHRSNLVVSDEKMQIFVPASNGAEPSAFGLHGQPLSAISFDTISGFTDFVREHADWEMHGMTDPCYQYIQNNFSGDLIADLHDFNVANVDIEVEHSEGFPEPALANQEILSITVKRFTKPPVSMGTKPLDKPGYMNCGNETYLLKSFVELWERDYPDILTGWNVEMFDLLYLVNRIKKVLGNDWVKRLSPFSGSCRTPIISKTNHRKEDYYEILGITTIDYMELYKKFNPSNQESYRLDYIAKVELGEGKLDYSEYGNSLMRLYAENFPRFIEYNERDVALVERLDDKMQFLQLAITIAFMTKCKLADAQGTVKIWDTLLYTMLAKKGMQPPPPPEPKRTDIVGGFVKEPEPGLKKWVVTLDLASLYPNIARTLNMSPETIVARGAPVIEEILRGEDVGRLEGCAIAANGSQYRQDVVGIIPEAMTFVLEQRDAIKKVMIAKKREAEAAHKDGNFEGEAVIKRIVIRLDAAQRAMKVVANGGYGALANRYFRYFDADIAEGITMTGQTVIRYIAAAINEKLNALLETDDIDYVIGSDTDSCMIDISGFVDGFTGEVGELPMSELVDVVDQFVSVQLVDAVLKPKFLELSNFLGSKKSTLSMKREAIADRALFRAKKHYILQVRDNEGVRFAEPQLKMVGIETARTTTPGICKVALEECIKIILNKKESDLLAAYNSHRDEFMSAAPHAIAFPRGVNEMDKWVGSDGMPIKRTPINVKAALCYNRMIDAKGLKELEHIREGTKLRFVYLKPGNPTNSNAIGFPDVLPPEFEVDEFIDREVQFEKAFATPLQSFTSLVGWHVEEQRVLDTSLFTEEIDTDAKPRRRSEQVKAPSSPRASAPAKPRKAKAAKPTISFD